jgi:hypothetical protein
VWAIQDIFRGWILRNMRLHVGRSLGWGYQSFWLVGPDAPSIVEAPGWVKLMPNAHNGYYDTMLEMGYIGYALLLTFIIARRARVRPRPRSGVAPALTCSLHHFLELPRKPVDARLRIFVGGIPDCRFGNRSIRAIFAADTNRRADPEAARSRRLTRRSENSPNALDLRSTVLCG